MLAATRRRRRSSGSDGRRCRRRSGVGLAQILKRPFAGQSALERQQQIMMSLQRLAMRHREQRRAQQPKTEIRSLYLITIDNEQQPTHLQVS
jgi:hypothetical protein